MRDRMLKTILFLFLLSFPITTAAHAQTLFDPEKWIREAEEAYAKVDSYTAIFHKQECVSGDLLEEETTFLKFKKPLKVYMKWIKAPYQGRELIYVEGWNNNRMKVHEGGIMGLFTVNLDPKGSLVMRCSRHPVTDAGIGHLINIVGENIRKGIKANELKVIDHGVQRMYHRKTQKVEGILSRDRATGYYGYRIVMNSDNELKLPIKIQVYDWEDQLIESYGYENLRLNPGLTDFDFDPRNPEYKF